MSNSGDIGSLPGKAVSPDVCSRKADITCVNSERKLPGLYSEEAEIPVVLKDK